MKSFKQFLYEFYDKHAPDGMTLWEMTGIKPKESGVDQHLWMSGKGHAKHGPRVKVSNVPGRFDDNDSFSVSVDHEPVVRAGTVKIKKEHLEKIKDWVKLNQDHLHKCWHSNTMGSQDHIDGLKKL